MVASSRDAGKVDAEATALEVLGSGTPRQTSDVQSRESLEELCRATVETFGRVDVPAVTSGVHPKSASEAVSFVTGQVLAVDGGFLARGI